MSAINILNTEDTYNSIYINDKYLLETSPAERLIMISPSPNILTPIANIVMLERYNVIHSRNMEYYPVYTCIDGDQVGDNPVYRIYLDFCQIWRKGNTTIGDSIESSGIMEIKYSGSRPSGKDNLELYRCMVRLTPLKCLDGTYPKIIFPDNLLYQKYNKAYNINGDICYIVDADDGYNSVYIWYFSEKRNPFYIETITPIWAMTGVVF